MFEKVIFQNKKQGGATKYFVVPDIRRKGA